MARPEDPVRVRQPKRSGARHASGPPAPKREERCPGAAAQLAAVHRTLRHGPPLQLQAAGAAGARPAGIAGANRTGLPDRLKHGVEAVSGVALDDVRVHYNSAEPAALQAHAFTQGADIHVAPGQEQHLAHEAWHVVQQKQGRVKPTLQTKDGVAINDESGLEREADVMGARALSQPDRISGEPSQLHRVIQGRLLKRVADAAPAVQRAVVVRAPAAALTTQQRNWNGLRDFVATLPDPLKTPINTEADNHEGEMYGNFDDQIGALYRLRTLILQKLDDAKIDQNSQDNIGWDQIWGFVSGALVASGLVVAAQRAGLAGGHAATGFRWTVKLARDASRVAMGSVPAANNRHAREDNLAPAQGEVRAAIVALNTEVDRYRNIADALPYT